MIKNTVRYDPAILERMQGHEKPVAIYRFQHRLDVMYGLEWQIATWCRELFPEFTIDEFLARLASYPPLGFEESELYREIKSRYKPMTNYNWITIFQEHNLQEQLPIKKKEAAQQIIRRLTPLPGTRLPPE
jgi:hypothetical protein